MNTSLHQWQADCLAALLAALGDIPVNDAERESLARLARFEDATVENIAAVIRRVNARTEAHGTLQSVARLRQQHDLCEAAGIDAGKDPHGALLAHLRKREAGR